MLPTSPLQETIRESRTLKAELAAGRLDLAARYLDLISSISIPGHGSLLLKRSGRTLAGVEQWLRNSAQLYSGSDRCIEEQAAIHARLVECQECLVYREFDFLARGPNLSA